MTDNKMFDLSYLMLYAQNLLNAQGVKSKGVECLMTQAMKV